MNGDLNNSTKWQVPSSSIMKGCLQRVVDKVQFQGLKYIVHKGMKTVSSLIQKHFPSNININMLFCLLSFDKKQCICATNIPALPINRHSNCHSHFDLNNAFI